MGLRERKKRRTRATLIEAAVQLCLDQGYDNTTVEQIAAAAEVSPRTFSRYFATKDAVVLTLLEDLVDLVHAELATIPYEVPVLEALRRAHVHVLDAVGSGSVTGVSSERIALMLRILNSTPTLKSAATEFTPRATLVALADRLGVGVEDRRVALVAGVWATIIVTACGDLNADRDGLKLGPDLMVKRICEVFEQFAGLTVGLG